MTIQEIPVAPGPQANQLRPPPSGPGAGPKQSSRTGLWVAVAVVVAVMVGLAGVIAWLMASTVPTDDYDAVRADLESAQEQVTALTEDNAALTAERDSLTDERDRLGATIAATAVAAKALAYIDLNFDPLAIDEMAQGGVDFSSYDELLTILGEDATLTEWVTSYDAFRMAERYVYETEDAQLIDAWNNWLGIAEIGSIEDQAAYGEILVRLDQLINEQLTPTDGDTGPALTGNDAG
jgi:hypothetical protein